MGDYYVFYDYYNISNYKKFRPWKLIYQEKIKKWYSYPIFYLYFQNIFKQNEN